MEKDFFTSYKSVGTNKTTKATSNKSFVRMMKSLVTAGVESLDLVMCV